MSLRCPACKSDRFFLVVEHTWSFKVDSIGMSDVIPGEKEDGLAGKTLVCDECDWGGWLEEYHHIKNDIIPLDLGQEEEEPVMVDKED